MRLKPKARWGALEKPRGGLLLLQLAALFSNFDRFAVAPMLAICAVFLGASRVARWERRLCQRFDTQGARIERM